MTQETERAAGANGDALSDDMGDGSIDFGEDTNSATLPKKGKTSLREMVVDWLSRPERGGSGFATAAIAAGLISAYPEAFAEKAEGLKGKKRGPGLASQLASEIGAQRSAYLRAHSELDVDTVVRPMLWKWNGAPPTTSLGPAASSPPAALPLHAGSVATPHPPTPTPPFAGPPQGVVTPALPQEHELYPVVRDWLRSEGVLSMRIDEKRSRNDRGPKGNMWLHPDIVGMEPLAGDWSDDIRSCAQGLGQNIADIRSIEVKVAVTMSSLREDFFQTVSNSAWANLAYLAALDFSTASVLQELEMLCGLHGIGLVRLSRENPSESQVVIPAVRKPTVDWQTANRIAAQNADFMEFVKRVLVYLRNGNVGERLWD
jgi:hypothetical protein